MVDNISYQEALENGLTIFVPPREGHSEQRNRAFSDLTEKQAIIFLLYLSQWKVPRIAELFKISIRMTQYHIEESRKKYPKLSV